MRGQWPEHGGQVVPEHMPPGSLCRRKNYQMIKRRQVEKQKRSKLGILYMQGGNYQILYFIFEHDNFIRSM